MSLGNVRKFNYDFASRPVPGGQWSTGGEERFAPAPPVPPVCDDAQFPKQVVDPVKGVTTERVNCPTRADAYRIVAETIKSAVSMLDITIRELTEARKAACRGETLEHRHLQPVTVCWLKYHLGVCVDDPAVWTGGTFKNKTVAEVIRRLVRPRDLLANNEITYVCRDCDSPNTVAGVQARRPVHPHDPVDTWVCIPGSPNRTVTLCAPFWDPTFAPHRAETLIHEASHLTHCDAGPGSPDSGVAASIGFAACVGQFVAVTNGMKLDPFHRIGSGGAQICGLTNACGPIPQQIFKGDCPGVK